MRRFTIAFNLWGLATGMFWPVTPVSSARRSRSVSQQARNPNHGRVENTAKIRRLEGRAAL